MFTRPEYPEIRPNRHAYTGHCQADQLSEAAAQRRAHAHSLIITVLGHAGLHHPSYSPVSAPLSLRGLWVVVLAIRWVGTILCAKRVQHDEVGDLPGEGRFAAPLGLPMVGWSWLG